jgi:hypothetical protein
MALLVACIFFLGFATASLIVGSKPANTASIENAVGSPGNAQQADGFGTGDRSSAAIEQAPDQITGDLRSDSGNVQAMAVGHEPTGTAGEKPTVEDVPTPAATLSAPVASADGSFEQGDWLGRMEDASSDGAALPGLSNDAALYEAARPVGTFYTFAIADFTQLKTAEKLKSSLAAQSISAEIVNMGKMADQRWFSVIVGRHADRGSAVSQGRELSQRLGRPVSPILLSLAGERQQD